MQIQPYLFFNGHCDAAIAHYQAVIGAEIEAVLRVKDVPDPPPPGTYPPGSENLVMHAALRVGDAVLMMSDGMGGGELSFKGFSVSLTVPDAETAARYFSGLQDGGQVHMPLGKTFFSPCFGVLADRFGLSWMIMVLPQP
jgi:PhnB protein